MAAIVPKGIFGCTGIADPQTFLAVIVEPTKTALISVNCRERSGTLIDISRARLQVLKNTPTSRPSVAGMAVAILVESGATHALSMIEDIFFNFKVRQCDPTLHSRHTTKEICEFEHVNEVVPTGSWALTDEDIFQCAALRIQSFNGSDGEAFLPVSNTFSALLVPTDNDPAFEQLAAQASYLANSNGGVRLSGRIIRLRAGRSLGLILQNERYGQFVFTDTVNFTVGDDVYFYPSDYVSVHDQRYRFASLMSKEANVIPSSQISPSQPQPQSTILLLLDIASKHLQFPNQDHRKSVENLRSTLTELSAGLQATHEQPDLVNLISTEELCLWLNSLPAFKRHRSDQAKELSLRLLRDANVTGTRLLDDLIAVDRDVLQSFEFPHSIRDIILQALLTFQPLPQTALVIRNSPSGTQKKIKNIVYETETSLGRGKSASVFEGTMECSDGELKRVAVKRIEPRTTDNVDTKRFISAEVLALREVKHQNIVIMHDAVFHPSVERGDLTFLVLELCRTNLRAAIEEKYLTGFGFDDFTMRVKHLILPICEGLQALHTYRSTSISSQSPNIEHGIMHRDIKPENILLVPMDSSPLSPWISKLCDMGFSLRCKQTGIASLTSCEFHTMAVGLGTEGYTCPDILTQLYGTKSVKFHKHNDIFSLGCVLYECLTTQPHVIGHHPFEVRTECQSPPRNLKRAAPRAAMPFNARRSDNVTMHIQNGDGPFMDAVHVAPFPAEMRRFVDMILAMLAEMVSSEVLARPDASAIVQTFKYHPALNPTARYIVMDSAVKLLGDAVRPKVKQLADLLADNILKAPLTPCPASDYYHAKWSVGTRRVFPGIQTGRNDVKTLNQARWEALLPLQRAQIQQRSVKTEDFPDYFDQYDGHGPVCICPDIADEIRAFHTKGQLKEWRNSDNTKWVVDGWEMLKLFLPSLGTRASTSPSMDHVDSSYLLHAFVFFKSARNLLEKEHDAFLESIEKIHDIRNNYLAHALTQTYELCDFEEHIETLLAFMDSKYLMHSHPDPSNLAKIRSSIQQLQFSTEIILFDLSHLSSFLVL